jgi:hypothetical protein
MSVIGAPPHQYTHHPLYLQHLIHPALETVPDAIRFDVCLPLGYAGACGASGFGLNCPSKASIFSVPQPIGSSHQVR